MKMVFFTNISHELRTPLSLILSPLPSLINRERDGEVVNKACASSSATPTACCGWSTTFSTCGG